MRTRMNKKKYLYVCKAGNGRNNELLEECGFQYAFTEIGSWNCPKCGAKLDLEGTSGKTVSEILSEGFREEKEGK